MKELTQHQQDSIIRVVKDLYFASTRPNVELAKEAIIHNLKPEFEELAIPFIRALSEKDINEKKR